MKEADDPDVHAATIHVSSRRRARVFCYCLWAEELQDAAAFVSARAQIDVPRRVPDPSDPRLLAMARLDCDWHVENVRVLASLRHSAIDFLPARALGAPGLRELVAQTPPPGEEWWFVLTGQQPRHLAGLVGPMLQFLGRRGVRTLYYSFDDASRNLACFRELAPHLAVLIHDEDPLDESARRALAPACLTIHRSWVANLLPFEAPFDEAPEEKILFLGSQLGFTPHRRRQVEFLQARFKDRMVAIHDHSVPVGERFALNRFKVGFCPEGRMFGTVSMGATHTDRPFWSGCLGLVPVAEDAAAGGRLDGLHRAGLIRRYPHGDLAALGAACEEALGADPATRRAVYDHFNRHETIGRVVADAIVEAGAVS
jgi:hypothetical protein